MKKKSGQSPWKVAGGILLLVILGALTIQWANAQWLDAHTRANAPFKITIIEIDDYWNIQDGSFAPYGYTYERYEKVLRLIESHGYRATLGAVPRIFNEEKRTQNILAEDVAMTRFLQAAKEAEHEIAQHGFTHCRNVELCNGVEENYENIAKGKKELEAIFGPIRTYLPPGNSWNNTQYYNAKVLGFDTVGNTHVPRPYFDGGTLITHRGFDVVSRWEWYNRRFDHHPLEKWIKSYENEPQVFILQLHSNTFDTEEKRADLGGFLDYLNAQNATVLTYRQVYRILRDAKNAEKTK